MVTIQNVWNPAWLDRPENNQIQWLHKIISPCQIQVSDLILKDTGLQESHCQVYETGLSHQSV